MKRSEKASNILEMLEEYYPETPVPLDHENPFQLLVAVLMSAQTTDKKVNQVTPELFRQGPAWLHQRRVEPLGSGLLGLRSLQTRAYERLRVVERADLPRCLVKEDSEQVSGRLAATLNQPTERRTEPTLVRLQDAAQRRLLVS